MFRALLLFLALLAACQADDQRPIIGGGGGGEGEAESESESESEGESGPSVLFVHDGAIAMANDFAALFAEGVVQVISVDEAVSKDFDGTISLVIIGPDTASRADDTVTLRSIGERYLGMGDGGQRSYEEIGSPLGDAACGNVGGIGVAQPDHPLFAGIPMEKIGATGGHPFIRVYETDAVFDCGVLADQAMVTYLAWDYRYADTFADIAFTGSDWTWGFGDTSSGGPDEMTDEGKQLFQQLVDFLRGP